MEHLKREHLPRHAERVLQFGEGNFLRGFVDWMFDRLNKEYHGDYGVVVIQPRQGHGVDRLNKQDGLYTLYLRGLLNGVKAEETRVVDCITRGINPYQNEAEFFKCAKNPDLRFIVSNTTEAGIEYKPSMEAVSETTFPGRLAMFLKARYDAQLPGFIILPCELIDRNGDCLKRYVTQYAMDWGYGSSFLQWLQEENCFANTLVDRIVTGYPHDQAEEIQKQLGYQDNSIDMAEFFHLWVIEGAQEYEKELPFKKIGLNVLWTDDVTPYKKRKVRILNGAHTMMALVAKLAGKETVRQAVEEKAVEEFIKKGIYNEMIPTIDMPKEELVKFADDVIGRFKNPFLEHHLSDIALNSVSKFRVRVLPSLLEYRQNYGKDPQCLVFSLAALILFYKTEKPNDDERTMEFIKTAQVPDILSNRALWGEDLAFLQESVERYLHTAQKEGIYKAMDTALCE